MSFLLLCLFTAQINKTELLFPATHHIVGGDHLLEDLWQQPLGLQGGVLLLEVEHQKGVVVGSGQARGKGQDALLQVSYCRKAT